MIVFRQLLRSDQTRTILDGELRSDSLYKSFLTSHTPVNRRCEFVGNKSLYM